MKDDFEIQLFTITFCILSMVLSIASILITFLK